MSIRVMARVWEHSRAAGGQLLVLLAIADFADDHGTAWPSVPTLAKKARISERHTQKVIKQLKGMGELVVDPKASGHWGTNLYKITLKAERGGNMPPGGELEATRGVASDAKGGELEATQTINNHHKNHIGKGRKTSFPNPNEFSPHEFLKVYASFAPKLPQPREATDGRLKKIRQRLKAHPGRDFWQEVFTKANQTPFLRGESDRGWKASLDWFVKNDENAVMVLEGKYDRGVQAKPAGPKYRDFDVEQKARDGN